MLTVSQKNSTPLTTKPQSVQFGCGLCAPSQWLNFDSSPALRLQKLPIIGNLIPSGPFGRYPQNVKYGDIVKGLPIAKESVDFLYCSHIFEHLTLNELRLSLQNCYQYLKPGGIFRFVLPDLEFMARQYVNSTSADAALEFMRVTWLGKENRQHDLFAFLKEWLSCTQHLWMWDYKSLSLELENVGFKEIRRAYLADSGISVFSEVEDPQRWENELGIQCSK
ncbi:MAG: class I SAM-dependent methyltransferase [Nostoc sp. ZfuVER08]|uniref:Methyltransferase domain-containing protein n=1 Tax=Nostoc punctiforme FACHB-252 TaxID=1357509 RepID=A0ABR8H3A0_NOSPU|nr:methyltransferase domain-containing protein [Nostoc punctiforme]MBD2609700.1 methyltransferase domain-containing protein [Nostoc punctiforme FACHB-252]MDZ8012901.1 methyltransferase domain-containing protein [Nostoc sp. ZfuVER08]